MWPISLTPCLTTPIVILGVDHWVHTAGLSEAERLPERINLLIPGFLTPQDVWVASPASMEFIQYVTLYA